MADKDIKIILEEIARGINPVTGERFDISELAGEDARKAVRKIERLGREQPALEGLKPEEVKYHRSWVFSKYPENLLTEVLGSDFYGFKVKRNTEAKIEEILDEAKSAETKGVILSRYKYNRTLQDISRHFGRASREWARQRVEEGLELLKLPENRKTIMK